MKWIVVAILIFIPVYTFLTLHYRKRSASFEPYKDLTERTDVVRLLAAGYKRIPIEALRPADEVDLSGGAPVSRMPGGIPEPLRKTLVDDPLLPLEVADVAARPVADSGIGYPVGFSYSIADNKRQLCGAHLYVRGKEAVIIPDFERIPGGLMSRWKDGSVLLTVPPGAWEPGTYRVTLVGERASQSWTLQVR
jgi:hypothetical protein